MSTPKKPGLFLPKRNGSKKDTPSKTKIIPEQPKRTIMIARAFISNALLLVYAVVGILVSTYIIIRYIL